MKCYFGRLSLRLSEPLQVHKKGSVSYLEFFLLLPEVRFSCDVAQPSHKSAIPSPIGNIPEILALLV